jgi:hypothetical protein
MAAALYIGVLKPSTSVLTPHPRVEAELAPRLIPCVPPAVHGAVCLNVGPSALLFGMRQRGGIGKRKPKTQCYKLIYYVCTHESCGWRGTSLAKHRRQKPACIYYPSLLSYAKSESLKDVVSAFLARCTPIQRKLGLSPDFAKPVPIMGAEGRFDPDRLYLTVPVGMQAGDCFTVPMGRGLEARITVPAGKAEGDVLQISSHAGRKRSSRELELDGHARRVQGQGADSLAVDDAAGDEEEGGLEEEGEREEEGAPAGDSAFDHVAMHAAANAVTADVVIVDEAEEDRGGEDDEGLEANRPEHLEYWVGAIHRPEHLAGAIHRSELFTGRSYSQVGAGSDNDGEELPLNGSRSRLRAYPGGGAASASSGADAATAEAATAEATAANVDFDVTLGAPNAAIDDSAVVRAHDSGSSDPDDVEDDGDVPLQGRRARCRSSPSRRGMETPSSEAKPAAAAPVRSPPRRRGK